MKESKIIVFVPGYNVSKTIEKVILALLKERKKQVFDIIYIDNCSKDDSASILQTIKKEKKLDFLNIIINEKNLGYGGSQKVAFEYAFAKKYNYLIEYDGDMQYSSDKIVNLYKRAKEGFSVVFGSRITNMENAKEMPKWKYYGNILSNKIISKCLRIKVSEIHTGFRAYNLDLLHNVNFNMCNNDYRWTIDSVIEILKINSNFSELPVKAYYHKDAKSPKFSMLVKTIGYMISRAIKFGLTRN